MIDHEKLSNWYNFQARFYHLWRDDYSSPMVETVARMLGPADGTAMILDAGCGTGFFAVGLATLRPGWTIEGLDAAEGMLTVAREQAARRGLSNATFRAGDAQKLPFDDRVLDGIVAAGLFPNLNAPGPALREFLRVLRPGGRLVLVEVNRDALSRLTRVLFRLMIFGYRAVSTLVPRFRFTDRWSIQASTVDAEQLTQEALATGFRADEREQHGTHLILRFEKGARS